jgi:S-(hydroxymethyl)glutathione dehydrogenase / alcohol dehydrogenase
VDVRAAIAIAANRPLEIVTLQLDAPGPGEVLVQMKATGLCHSDLTALEGRVPRFSFPMVLGHEGAGIVVECGPGVTTVAPGDHVVPSAVPECRQCHYCASGRTNMCVRMFEPPVSRSSYHSQPVTSFCGTATFAEYSVIAEDRLAKIRSDAPLGTVCYVGCGVLTGVGAVLRTGQVTPGSTVAVFGLGGIGLNVIQGARIAGARRIIGVDVNPERQASARGMGATDFVNPREVEGELSAHLRGMTNGGVDFAFECVGNEELVRQALESTNPAWGVAVGVGIVPPGKKATFEPSSFMTGRTWKGSFLGNEKPRSVVPRLVDWYMDGFLKIDELITHRISLEQINEGFDLMRTGKAIRTVIEF